MNLASKLMKEVPRRPSGMVTVQCPQHGLIHTLEREDGRSICPECLIAREDAQARDNAKVSRLEHLRHCAKLPARFASASIKGYKTELPGQAEAVRAIRDWLKRYSAKQTTAGVLLLGNPGNGKTHLACAILRNVIETMQRSARYVTTADMIDEIRAAIGDDSKSVDGEIERFARFDLLVIDELDMDKVGEDDRKKLFQVINRRNLNLLPTIGIANQSLSVLAELIGQRTVERLMQDAVLVTFDWMTARRPHQLEAA